MGGGYMLWQKSWWETRWFFLYTLAMMNIVSIPFLWLGMKADPGLPPQPAHPGMAWMMWFKFLMTGSWPILALLMGMTILKSFPLFDGPPGHPGLFTLSLPITRRKLLLTHWTVVIMEMTLISMIPASLISIISNFNGYWFPMKDAVLFSLFMGIGGTVFVSFSYLLIVIFKNNAWAIIGPVVVVNILLHWPLSLTREFPWWNIFHVMSGETYFLYGQIPWLGLLASLVVSITIMVVTVRIYDWRDF